MNEPTVKFQFGADFSALETIPEDPRERSQYFQRFKSFLNVSRNKIKAWHRQGAGGREVIQAHAGLIDETIKHVVLAIAGLEAFRKADLSHRFALIAVGGYGRGELNPCSDIDLLFLLNKKLDRQLDSFIQEIISVLWGIGLEIGHSCRTLKECQTLAREDSTVRTSMIETRFLVGAKELYERLWDSVYKNVPQKHAQQYLDTTLRQFFARPASGEGVTSHPEPDIKNGPGGLRDYHVAMWAVAMCFDGTSLAEIDRDDILDAGELQTLKKSVNFLLRVRNELHYLTGKKADVLTRSIQMDLAHHLGYEGNGAVAVERFMREYFLHATHIHTISEAVFHRCLESRPLLQKVITSLQHKKLASGFLVYKSQLRVPDHADDLFETDRALILTAFNLCRDHDLELDAQLKRLIRLNKHRLDAEFIRGMQVKTFLYDLLKAPKSFLLLRQMHEAGVLGQLLPEFEQSLFEVHYDFYHRYTSDEHALRMVRFLEELDTSKDVNLNKLKQVYVSIPDRVVLKLACLLQTFGNRPGDLGNDHAESPLADVARRLQLTPKQQGTLHFLVKHKNMMNELAFHHDIHHPPTIRNLGHLTGQTDRLDLLFLLSYADLKAVAPETWTEWKNILLTELYHRTRNFLVRPESIDEKPKATRNAVYSLLADEFDRATISEHMDAMPEDYFLTESSEDIADHIRLIQSMGGRPFSLKATYHEKGGFYNLVVAGPSDIHLFKNLVGTLTARAMNILGAQIFARNGGLTVLIIQVNAQEVQKLYRDMATVWQEIEDNVCRILDKQTTLGDLLRTRTRFHEKKNSGVGIEPKIQIDNWPEDRFTRVRIEARDHPGMLYKIVFTLAQFGIELHRAKIAVRGGRGIDMFSVSLRGGKILFQPLIQRIKDKIIQDLLVEKLEELS
ncbi:[protein-PII] uridylyltransferase [Nitrospina watsonii]|uniref:Bifunctional uridylyltransferase/uridylyl-removing enzyme n=1 Tax=Nitrospina watsonii TaxID=1323948 RepID=A0ABN8VSP6_9BACT|nr:[protein-PII] uridylyltransferase [Nitrospina watsonii]CAI2716952.1 [Protein-PII] uridylyltransferase,[Protein-PII]-UMP uridylyl-removing enzyme [Nitrospina watsonii]